MKTETTETSIIRPNIFPECTNCPIVLKEIYRGLIVDIPKPYTDAIVKKISIKCLINNSQVSMASDIVYDIQFVKKRPILEVEGEGISRLNIACPHFHQ